MRCLCPPQIPSTLVRSPLKGRRGLTIVLLNPPPGRRTDGLPLLHPVTLQTSPSAVQCRFFLHFCFLSGFVHRDFLLLSQKGASPSLGQSAPPGPSPIARCARQAASGPVVAAHIVQWRGMLCCHCQPHPWSGNSIRGASTPCLRAARMLNLQNNPFAQETGCACAPSPPLRDAYGGHSGFPAKSTTRGVECC